MSLEQSLSLDSRLARTQNSSMYRTGMPVIGVCKLCQKKKELLKSHYMPAALYSRNLELEYATRNGAGVVMKENEIKARFLCRDCETLFKLKGEDEQPVRARRGYWRGRLATESPQG